MTNWHLAAPLADPRRAWFASARPQQHGALTIAFHGSLDDIQPGQDPNAAVARAIERDGIRAFASLRGSFVAAVLDRRTSELWVSRDPMGTFPLFFAVAGEMIRFAGTPNTLLAAGVSPALNRAALADRLCRRFLDAGETYYEAIRRPPKGHVIRVGRGRVSVEPCWTPAVPSTTDESAGDRHARFEAILDRAVARCVAPGSSAILLSGGVDSTTVAMRAVDLARRTQAPAPLALSLGFADPECDERRIQRATAHALGMPHELVDFDRAVGAGLCGPASISLSKQLTWPLMAPGAPAYAALFRRGADLGATVLLDGVGGDEWCSVPTRRGADLLRRFQLPQLVRFARAWQRSLGVSWTTTASALLWHAGARQLATTAINRVAPRAWSRRRAARIAGATPAWLVPDPALRQLQQARLEASLAARHARGGFNLAELRIGLEHPTASLELEETFDLASRAGVLLRHPLLDPDLVEFVCRTPPEFLMRDGQLKGALRAPLAARFPGLGWDRRPKALATGFVHGLQRAARERVDQELKGFPALSRLGLIDGRRAWQALDNPGEAGMTSGQCWELLAVEAWINQRAA